LRDRTGGYKKHYTEEKQPANKETNRQTEKVNKEAPLIVVPMERRGYAANNGNWLVKVSIKVVITF